MYKREKSVRDYRDGTASCKYIQIMIKENY